MKIKDFKKMVKEIVEQEYGVGEVHLGVVVGIGGLHAAGLDAGLEEVVQNLDGIGEIHLPAGVDISA